MSDKGQSSSASKESKGSQDKINGSEDKEDDELHDDKEDELHDAENILDYNRELEGNEVCSSSVLPMYSDFFK